MMENAKERTLAALDAAGIRYDKLEHPVVCTMEEMDAAGITARGNVCKNLFVRDQKGKNHFLIVALEEKKVDLTDVADQIGSSRLSFGSPERLEKYLGVSQGSVSPLGILNDEEHEVIVVFDQDLRTRKEIGVHPNENTATIWLSFRDLRRFIENQGNEVDFVKLPK